MSGRVLLVDDIATNRIILKVKLSAAYYDVIQAASLQEARTCLISDAPDLVIVSQRLVRSNMKSAYKELTTGVENPLVPVILLCSRLDTSKHVDALQTGFDEVLSYPLQERYLMSRLRSLLRGRQQSQELENNGITADALGFADPGQSFANLARILLVSDNRISAQRLQSDLKRHTPHAISATSSEKFLSPRQRSTLPSVGLDILIADIRNIPHQDALRRMADLNAALAGCECPVLPLISEDATELASTLLDMGAQDILFEKTDPREMALRLSSQLSRKRASDKMRDQIKGSLLAAVTDPLTGLFNRRYALSFLKCLLQEQEGNQRDFAVMVADLDHFKQINDRFGHTTGDAVLTRVAKILTDQLNEGDLVARIGGEEFLIILPNTDRQKAQQVAQNLREAVQTLTMQTEGNTPSVGVTVSIGLTVASPSAMPLCENDNQSRTLLELADRALYTSKAEGRNTVTFNERNAA